MTDKLTHFDDAGRAHMVEVGEKDTSKRRAIATGHITLSSKTLALIRDGKTKKGDVLAVAELAGIMGAKQTAQLIPLCHPLALTGIKIDLQLEEAGIRVTAQVTTIGKTGVEMEALAAVSIACLTVYDMVKAVEREAVIGAIKLIEKTGGKSDYQHD